MSFSNKKGFTLIELLIVIAIIGILAVAFLPSLLNAPAKGRDAQRLATVQKIQNFLVTKALASSLSDTTACILESAKAAGISKTINDNIANFGGVFPKDPDKSFDAKSTAVAACTGGYGFVNFATNKTYDFAVYARVENQDNANIKCLDIKDEAANMVLNPDKSGWQSTDAGCYIVLSQ